MIEPVLQRKGNVYLPYSETDRILMLEHPEYMMLHSKITAASPVKSRSYRELCCYMGSCRYIADQNFNANMNHKDKVDAFTRTELGFIKHVFVGPFGGVQFINESLSYANCNQPKAHRFIAAALQDHAELIGMKTSDEYVAHLRQLGQGYDGR